MSKAKKKVKMKPWVGYVQVHSSSGRCTSNIMARDRFSGFPGHRIARVEVREIVTKRSKG